MRKPKLLALPRKNPKVSSEAILFRQEKAFQMRVDENRTLDSIAKELGVSRATICEDLKTVSKMKYYGMIEKDYLLLARQNSTMDKLLEQWVRIALGDPIVGETRITKKGEEYDITLPVWESKSIATDKIMKIMEHQARINGLVVKEAARSPAEEVGLSVIEKVLKAFTNIEKQEPKRAEVIEV